MRTVDFSPLYRSSVGFDHLFNLLENASRGDQKNNGYPPYNIEALGKDKYQITLAVAGFSESELDIQSNHNRLTIKGNQTENRKERTFLHQGIANRNFERTFELAEHVKVIGAELKNGLLIIDLEKEIPEAMKPRKIEIGVPKLN
ncbi:MAG: heat-shock protein [Oleiphilus sp.]|nr:MAG: heat-shock protein [Oleiphilus sp.]